MSAKVEQMDAKVHSRAVSTTATSAVLVGCIVATIHLVLGGTTYLALSTVDLFAAWPYFLAFTLVVAGLVTHAAAPVSGRPHVAITVGSGIIGALALPVAWFYFGWAGIGLENDADQQVVALMGVFIASVIPVVAAFVGGVFSWRNLTQPARFRVRGIVIIAVTSIALATACIIFARLSYPVPDWAQ